MTDGSSPTDAGRAPGRVTRAPRWWLALALLPVLLSCGGGRATAEDAYRSLRSALRTGATSRVLALHDAEAQAYFRQRVRTVRARVAAGEPIAQIVAGDAAAPRDYLDGTLDEAAARVLIAGSQLGTVRPWIDEGTIIDARVEESSDSRAHAVLRVRAVDGTERDLYFVRESDGWAFDAFRHFTEAMQSGRR